MTDSTKAQSIKARLLNKANGNNKKYQQLIVRYFQERFLHRLSRSALRDKLILKGGALLYAYTEFMPRPTLDIDFLGHQIDNNKDVLLSAIKDVVTQSDSDDGVRFLPETLKAEDIALENKYPGVRIQMIGTLGTYQQKLIMDIGFGDVLFPGIINLKYPGIFDKLEEPMILSYPLETVVAEKFQTMIDRGRFNSRMKDYFDVYRIIIAHKFKRMELSSAIRSTFKNRGTEHVENHDFFQDDFGRDVSLDRQWNNYINKLKLDLPCFNEIHKVLVEFLQPHWEELRGES